MIIYLCGTLNYQLFNSLRFSVEELRWPLTHVTEVKDVLNRGANFLSFIIIIRPNNLRSLTLVILESELRSAGFHKPFYSL